MIMMRRPGDKVYKPKGYPFPGTVVAAFKNLNGDERYVVESLKAPGMLHIFAPTQLELAPIEQPCRKCGHPWRIHEHEVKLTDRTVSECMAPMGMGDWCGCENKVPDEIKDLQEEVWS